MTSQGLIATVLVAALAPSVAVAAGPKAERRASVEVDTSNVGEAGPIVQRRVAERADVVLRDAEVLPGTEPSDPVIHVAVHEVVGDDPGFFFELWVERSGRVVGERRRVECNLCTETEIVAKAEGEIAAVVAALEPTEPEPVPATATSPTPENSTSPSSTDPDDGKKHRGRLGAKGKAGVALLAIGVATLGTGVGLSIPAWEPVDDEPTRERSTRPVGFALVGVGAATLVTGAVLLGLDRRSAKRRKATAFITSISRGPAFVLSAKF